VIAAQTLTIAAAVHVGLGSRSFVTDRAWHKRSCWWPSKNTPGGRVSAPFGEWFSELTGSMYPACVYNVFDLQSTTVYKLEYQSFTFEEVTNCSKSRAVFLRKPFLLQQSNQGCCIELAQVLGRGFHHLSHSYRDLACHFPHWASMQDAHGTSTVRSALHKD